ncbi:transposase [Actinomyces sp.]|uniref:transposase n=1 Tax=Actinomyces sp. TaxID=29317 RepID=UPI0026DAA641|nr:transposase [Actinomyces sp.]MDO4899375.1 transposase [Actinomyces sp.]
MLTRTGTTGGRRVIAVDGKTMRGAKGPDGGVPHLLAALDQSTGAVVAQQRVADKSSEIPALKDLLEPHDLQGTVVTADAQRSPSTAPPNGCATGVPTMC